MKKLLVYILLFQLVAFMSCKKEIMSYEGREGVYFAVQHGLKSLSINFWPYQPYSPVDFVSIGKDVVDFPIKIMITGPVKDYDRTFRVEVNPDSTTAIAGQHYEPVQGEFKIPAGKITTNIILGYGGSMKVEKSK